MFQSNSYKYVPKLASSLDKKKNTETAYVKLELKVKQTNK